MSNLQQITYPGNEKGHVTATSHKLKVTVLQLHGNFERFCILSRDLPVQRRQKKLLLGTNKKQVVSCFLLFRKAISLVCHFAILCFKNTPSGRAGEEGIWLW